MKKNDMFIKGFKSDSSMMILSAVRYALGRRTYVVNWTCEFVANNLHLLLPKDVKIIIRDIKEQERDYSLGDKCDVNDWKRLLIILENHLKEVEKE